MGLALGNFKLQLFGEMLSIKANCSRICQGVVSAGREVVLCILLSAVLQCCGSECNWQSLSSGKHSKTGSPSPYSPLWAVNEKIICKVMTFLKIYMCSNATCKISIIQTKISQMEDLKSLI